MQGATTPPMNSRCCDGFVGNTNDWVDFEIEGAKVLRKYDLTYTMPPANFCSIQRLKRRVAVGASGPRK